MTTRGWCGTLNNPQLTGEVYFNMLKATLKNGTYLVMQREKGESGTPHFQLYVHWPSAVSMSTCKQRLMIGGWHLEKAMGSPAQNQTYCTKEEGRLEGPWEFGTVPQQGKRSDIQAALEDLKKNPKSLETIEFIDKHPGVWVKYDKMLTKYRDKLLTVERPGPKVLILIGSPGIGKSRWCQKMFPKAFWMSNPRGWWDGYIGQDTVILDDFDALMFNGLGARFIKNLWDRYPLMVEVKGGMVQMQATTFIVTSNYPMKKWGEVLDPKSDKYDSSLVAALDRRITDEVDMTGDNETEISAVFGALSQKYGEKQSVSETDAEIIIVEETPQKKRKADEVEEIED
jgi:hypothetical protein